MMTFWCENRIDNRHILVVALHALFSIAIAHAFKLNELVRNDNKRLRITIIESVGWLRTGSL